MQGNKNGKAQRQSCPHCLALVFSVIANEVKQSQRDCLFAAPFASLGALAPRNDLKEHASQ
jgi:hypothetical protein